MKEELINLIRNGELQKALSKGEEFLKIMNDNYYSWTTLQSRFNDKQNQNTKGILSNEEYTQQINLINSQIIDLILKIDTDLQNNNNTSSEKNTIKDKIQNSLIGSYEVLDILSEGSVTITYRAKELFDDDYVAIKALKFDDFNNNSEIFDEINKVKSFNHRNLISIIGKSGMNASPQYVILQYIDGIPLKKIVAENGPRPIEETKRILLKLCEALYYLHKRKVFSADLRASRIFIDKEGEPIFAPFILFRSKSDSNYNQIVSNLKFMSYQRLNSKDFKNNGPQSNQFSIGVLAYLLIVGEPLFVGSSIVDLIEARNLFEKDEAYREEKLSKLDCPEELQNFVKTLLSRNQSDRFSSIHEIIFNLKKMKNHSSEHNRISQESYLRACSYNPKITFELINEINNKDIDSFPDLNLEEFAKKFHTMINLIIETDSNKSYLIKALQSKELSQIFFIHNREFKELFYELLKESDYLWSETIQSAWEMTLNETFEKVKGNFVLEEIDEEE